MDRIGPDGIKALVTRLQDSGYTVVGPTIKSGAISYEPMSPDADLPAGLTVDQEAGKYTLRQSDSNLIFGYTLGPHSWKQLLYQPVHPLVTLRRRDSSFQSAGGKNGLAKYAFFGVRSCDLRAIQLMDTVLAGGTWQAEDYRSLRETLFIVAVNCTNPGNTCFCASMQSGPEATSGYDLVLTEIETGGDHYFLVKSGTGRGADLLASVPHRPAGRDEIESERRLLETAARSMGRTLDTRNIKEKLAEQLDHPRWEETGNRCLTCGNCTLVCPTCFCSTIEDTTDLSGSEAVRTRKWDSCFTLEFSYIHGGSVRSSSMARYRQWLTHKLSWWVDQFGTFGCVGCGRCITWCPVGIDITEETKSVCGQYIEA